MVSVSEATAKLLGRPFKPRSESIPLDTAVGRVLAEAVQADRNLPPFNRATMDGIAIAFDAFESGRKEFQIMGILPPGQPARRFNSQRGCIEIMTGAMLPVTADTVVRYEDIIIKEGVASVQISKISKGDFVHAEGADVKKDTVLLSAGIKLSPAEIALLATVGKSNLLVFSFPRLAIVSTGDELVDINDIPARHQIRSSNAHALVAALREMNCAADQFHLWDERDQMTAKLTAISSTYDVIVLSGGVSKGKFDHVPEVLSSLGIEKVFHQVSQRPGKPFWFGTSEKNTVFALPGNPVSTFLCFYRYVKPWLLHGMNVPVNPSKAILGEDYDFKPSLTYFLQVRIKNEDGRLLATPDAGGGSGDFANLKDIDGFLELPDGGRLFKKGEVFSFIPFRYF